MNKYPRNRKSASTSFQDGQLKVLETMLRYALQSRLVPSHVVTSEAGRSVANKVAHMRKRLEWLEAQASTPEELEARRLDRERQRLRSADRREAARAAEHSSAEIEAKLRAWSAKMALDAGYEWQDGDP